MPIDVSARATFTPLPPASAVASVASVTGGTRVLTIADDGEGIQGESSGTGLSIVRALVRDELHGEIALESDGGLRAEVVFPA